MEKVKGIGGVFFRAHDAVALSAWYRDHLGVDPVPQGPGDLPWSTAGGATVFAPFPEDTTYFAADKGYMINFRVDDLEALVAQLDAAGIITKRLPDMEGVGKFAHLSDPEGNAIELWEPAAP
ncbi:MAG: VOC family protein [Pseudomonadota bacterium]